MPSDLDPIPVRPRRRREVAPEPAEPKTNGVHQVDFRTPEPVRRLTRSIEEVHAAARALSLPPIRVEWEPGHQPETDPERQARKAEIDTFLSDYGGLADGPLPMPLNLIAAPESPDTFLLGNLIRPGTTVMLAGPPGAAKSWASRQMALAAASGTPLFLDRYEIERPLRVLVIDEDNGPDEEWRRDETLMAHLGLHRQQLTTVYRSSLAGVQLDQERWQLWLRGQIRVLELDLVILDPISEMHGGEELRKDPAFRSMLAFLKRLKVDFPHLATVIVHHTRKPASGDRTKDRGLEEVRGQWGQTPDVVAMMSPMGDRRAKWEVHKRVRHSSLILEQVAEGHLGEGGLRMVADATVMRNKATETDDRVLGAIDAGATTAADVEAGSGLSHGGVYKALKRLAAAGIITKNAPYERVEDPEDDGL